MDAYAGAVEVEWEGGSGSCVGRGGGSESLPFRAQGRRFCVEPAEGPGPGSESLLPDLGFAREKAVEDEVVALRFVAHLSIGPRA